MCMDQPLKKMVPVRPDGVVTFSSPVVEDWTGIPVGRMVKDEIGTVLHLADNLEKRIIGQRHALEMIAKRFGDPLGIGH